MKRHLLSIAFLLVFVGFANQVSSAEFELKDGDRVVLLGDALIEQEQYFGWIEIMLSTSFADRDVSFRNLGWSADTPSGDSRFGLSLMQAGREPADEGWKQLIKQLELTKPSVVIFGYGMASSLEGGPTGLDGFRADFDRLVDQVKRISPKARFLFLSPIGRIDGDAHHDVIGDYAKSVAAIAKHNASPFVDLTGVAVNVGQRKDPIHLNEAGYRNAATAIQQQLGLQSDWADSPHTDALRDVVLKKNTWWFHRSRPANMAYVFGFRKREQGQNAVEIPKFDALILEEEKRIAALRRLEAVDWKQPEPQIESQYAKFAKQPTPEFSVGEDLEVTLWAENPLLNKPIQINFDPQGRLWVASSEAYPMIEVGQSNPDKILILEDTDNDGKCDKSVVFADGLLIPTGVEPTENGCYVAQSTDLLLLKDTDGDGKADSKTRVLSGFGTEDTHHNLHTLRWGPDGRLYMNQSVYTRTDAETPRGVVRLKAGGGFRYQPESMRMQVFFRGLWNSWGHQFDKYGQSFLTDGAGFAGIGYAFPGATFFPTPRARHQLDLISPGRYPKFCSKEIIYGDSFPAEWQGSIVTCDFRANRVTRFSLSEQDAGFVTKQEDDLLRTAASTFRPIDVKQGPDGALYIADWSNPIINHGEVDFRDERRDRWHGRIWRLSWKKGRSRAKEDLTKLKSEELFSRLTSDDRYTRDQSRRVLMTRKDQIADQVAKWTDSVSGDWERLQAVWLQQGLDVVKESHLISLSKSSDHKIRSAAVRIAADLADPTTDSKNPISKSTAALIFTKAIGDEHPRVRLEAVRALGRTGTSEAAALALEAANHPRDRFIDFALKTTLDELADPFLAALEAGQWTPGTKAKEQQLDFALSSIDPNRAGSYLAKQLAKTKITKDGSGPWIELIGKAGSKNELGKLFAQTTGNGFDAQATRRALGALTNAQRLRKQRPGGDLNAIARLIDSKDEPTKVAAIRLIGEWKLASQIKPLAAIAEQGKTPTVRGTAINALASIGRPAMSALEKLAGSSDLGVRRHATISLASVAPGRGAKPFYATLAIIENEKDALALWRGFLGIKNGGKILNEQFPKEGVSQLAARAGLTAAKDGGRNEPQLLARLTPLAKVEMKAPELTPQRVKTLISKVENEGNPGRGESVYSRQDLACINCHAIGGVGGKVGPDMTSIGASAPIDYLIESIYKPNAKIKENYHSVIVATDDGKTRTGIVVDSNDDELVIRDAENKVIRILQDEIVAQKPGQSLMPAGVVDRLTEAEQVDLIKFLTQLGRPGNFDASKGGVARVYEVLAGTHRVEQKGSDRIISGELKQGWKPLFSRVNGDLYGSRLEAMTKPPFNISLVNVYLRTKVEASQDGDVSFSVNGSDKAAMWIDGKEVAGDTSFKTTLKSGEHTVLIRLDGKSLPKAFRLVSRDVTFSTE